MSERCPQCGEQLLGAVNRCWRCGKQFAPLPGAEAPPAGSFPIDEPLAASTLSPENRQASPGAMAEGVDQSPAGESGRTPALHVGSPFAEPGGANRATPADSMPPGRSREHSPPVAEPRVAAYPRHVAAAGGAVASVVLGVLSGIGATLAPAGAIVTALLGIAMGIWGLFGKRRRLAVAGLVLCGVVLAFSSFSVAVSLYETIHGVSPWELDAPNGEPFLDQ